MIPRHHKAEVYAVLPPPAVNDNWMDEDEGEQRFLDIRSETKPTP